jgi:PAS domain S-box-containing protein
MSDIEKSKEELLQELQELRKEHEELKTAHIKDISERQQIEQALKESELKYRSLIEYSNDVIFCVDHNGQYMFANNVFASTLGKTPDYFIGKTFWDVYPKEHADFRYEVTKRVFRTGVAESVEVVVPLPDRTLYYIATANPVKDSTGKVIMTLTHATDITKVKEAEFQLKKYTDELIEVNASKDKFFSIIAHDLRSPFNGFLGLTKMMAEDIEHLSMKEVQEFSSLMQKNADNLFKLLENLLEWARMQRGVTEFNPENCLLTLFVNQILDVQSEVAKAKEIELVSHIPEDAAVTVDIPMFNTILRNLISNAIKFTPRGGNIEIGVLVQPSEGLVIYVKDSGIGMNEDTISKLFKLDEKVSRPGTEGEASTGLGLLLCKEFVEKHGGKIWVESEVDKGSKFYFSLPNN